MATNKIILVIVEGKTDENALAPALSKIFPPSIKFKVMNCDLTSDYDSSEENIEDRIKRLAVKRFLERNNQFYAKDICAVIQIIDTDGAFVNDDLIITNDTLDKVKYFEDHIETNSTKLEELLKSREQKRKIVNHLVSIKTIRIPFDYVVPYRIYYMSNNLDCVISNNKNAEKEEKIDLTLDFGDNYDNPKDFIEYFNDSSLKVHGNYDESWLFIRDGLNSLKRFSNFHLFLNEILIRQ